MNSRTLLSACLCCLGIFAAACFLLLVGRIPETVPRRAVSGAYNTILLGVAVGLGGIVHGWVGRRRKRLGSSARWGTAAQWLGQILVSLAAGIGGVHFVDLALKGLVAFEYQRVMPLFDLTAERNLPTLFSTALFLLSTCLLWVIARALEDRQKPWIRWSLLSVLFAFLALDELASLHESIEPLADRLPGASGFFAGAWTLVYGVLLIPIGVFFVPLVRGLDATTRWRVVSAGILFLTGALGLEVVAAWYWWADVGPNLGGRLLVGLKELFEIAGLVVFSCALVDYLEREIGVRVLAANGETPLFMEPYE